MRPTILLSLALGLVARVAARSFEEHKARDGVQVWQNSRMGRDIMWGRCNRWFRRLKSCVLPPGVDCTAHLSAGPADADVEVRLGNLPVFDGHPTFVQFWAARKSDAEYDALVNPDEAAVYDDMFQAYPRYHDPDFNGGNVRVDSNGEAVIRFRAPATHLVGRHARVPHVHIRICSSGQRFSIILGRRDKVQLTAHGPIAKSECNTDANKLHVVSSRSLRMPRQTSLLKPLLGNGLVQRGMKAATQFLEHLDLDTLEFSPVFQCLSAKLLYDHIEGDCAQNCPEGTVLTHGQCVKPASSMQSFSAMWDLHVCGCDEQCWADKKNMTMHRLRLEIAEHMDIPLHEVHELDISFMSATRPGQASVARMHIRITSPRHTLQTGSSMLRSLFYDSERSSEVLAMLVLGSRELYAQDLGFLHKRSHTDFKDAYLPYYQDLEIVKQSSGAIKPQTNGQTDNLSMTASGPKINFGSFLHGQIVALVTVPILFLLRNVFWRLARKARAREIRTAELSNPLAEGCEDPPLFPAGRSMVAATSSQRSRAIAQPGAVGRYLIGVYARALK